MCVRASAFINREDKPKPKSRLHLPNRFEVDAKPRISEQTVMPGSVLIQARFPFQFKNRMNSCTSGNCSSLRGIVQPKTKAYSNVCVPPSGAGPKRVECPKTDWSVK
jgi:hypothetical protein